LCHCTVLIKAATESPHTDYKFVTVLSQAFGETLNINYTVRLVVVFY